MKPVKILITLLISLTLFSNFCFSKPLNLREKIGQMLILGFEGKELDSNSPIIKAIYQQNIGGVILFDYNYKTGTFDKNIESPQQVKRLNHFLQNSNRLANLKYQRSQLPLLISVDYEGGGKNADRLKKDYGFPETQLAETVAKMGKKEAAKMADLMGKTLNDAEFNLDFAPILDVNVNPENPVIGKLGRSFSADPSQVAEFASIYSRQFLNHKVQCAYKHFPGHGSASADSHLSFVDVTDSWQSFELDPYKSLLGGDNSCGMVMTAHIVNRHLDESGLPATLSRQILTGVLREQLQFKGVIVTDDMQMKAIAAHYPLDQALTLTINAGTDMIIFGNQLDDKPVNAKDLVDLIEAKVKSGEIKPERINEAYERIRYLKLGL